MNDLFRFDFDEAEKVQIPPTPPRQEGVDKAPAKHAALADLANCDSEPGSLVWQLSHPSQMSLVARYMALDDTARDAFEERAAILEHDAGLPRPAAETLAFREVMQAYRDLDPTLGPS
ncbi:hypothetical protein OG2516_07178 [Oceanicola granulosus HTCC2516]|uniref:Uncharacterized protein n=1 Tax=Oceanicola granulosus (strain ATCC BAA-861 / DSM 15982 / KCTC 12143 / HTCC2516) TaxID=314256 RepID=Q2CCC4_OCEGH|nr:hypothetical protein [Oceanicola granulosus]EAR50309.1 hypothetical protein OG2516_07178 [Oceanicola granulosus HTCC2516]